VAKITQELTSTVDLITQFACDKVENLPKLTDAEVDYLPLRWYNSGRAGLRN